MTAAGGLPAVAAADVRDDRYPWVAMAVVILGTFMVILDTTVVNVALPQIGEALHSRSGIEWVVTAYLLAVGVAQPPTGWLSDRYGRKRVFMVSMAVFGAGSLLSALSPTLPLLVGARVVQGLGGGAVNPVGMAMIYELFPPDRRGTALGVWGVAAMAAPAFGPVMGGYLVTAVSWHWLFLINVPVCIVAVFAAVRLLRDTGYREERAFDAVGLGLITTALVVWLLTFDRATEWGWSSPITIGCLLVGAVLLVAFGLWERSTDHPIFDLTMFRSTIFTLTLVVVGIAVVVQYAILVFLPLELEGLRGMTALRVGVALTPMAVAAAITFPLGGRLTDAIGPRYPVVAGAALLGGSAWMLAHLDLTSPTRAVVLAIVIQGLGYGLALMPNSVTGLNALPRRFIAQATAVRQLNQRVAASFGVAVLATVLVTQSKGFSPASTHVVASTVQDAYNHLFLVVAVLAAAATVLALFLPGRRRNQELLRDRTAEQAEVASDAGLDERFDVGFEAG